MKWILSPLLVTLVVYKVNGQASLGPLQSGPGKYSSQKNPININIFRNKWSYNKYGNDASCLCKYLNILTYNLHVFSPQFLKMS